MDIPETITLHLDDHLRKTLAHLAEGTDATPEEIACKAIRDAAMDVRVAEGELRQADDAYGNRRA